MRGLTRPLLPDGQRAPAAEAWRGGPSGFSAVLCYALERELLPTGSLRWAQTPSRQQARTAVDERRIPGSWPSTRDSRRAWSLAARSLGRPVCGAVRVAHWRSAQPRAAADRRRTAGRCPAADEIRQKRPRALRPRHRPIARYTADAIRRCVPVGRRARHHELQPLLAQNSPRLSQSGWSTPHVLRHSFASEAAELQYGAFIIAALLGHSIAGVTAGYTHIGDAALLAAANGVARRIQNLMAGVSSAAYIHPARCNAWISCAHEGGAGQHGSIVQTRSRVPARFICRKLAKLLPRGGHLFLFYPICFWRALRRPPGPC